MNGVQVYREVSALISEGHIESEGSLRASLNRALAEVGRIHPRKDYLTVRHFPLPTVFRLSMPREVNKDTPLTVSADSCEGFWLKGGGRGEVFVSSGDQLLFHESLCGAPFDLARSLAALCGKERAPLSLVFRSDEEMVIEELVLYEKLYGGEIPKHSAYKRYRLGEREEGFLSFSGECRKNRLPLAEENDEVLLERDSVLILSKASGIYEIGYYAAPRAVTKENEEMLLDISADLYDLVILLTAYYACLEAGDARAEAFLARYKASSDAYRNSLHFALNETVEDCKGW